ncbi:MAG: sigma-54-dependent Fis family transcriptional regulator [Bdellovibrio sp.]|nr:sigma-54-dependent Fis family transcriptional regulator [Bdellovibrio sp.]
MLAFRSPLVGESPAIQNIFITIEKVSQTDSTVLITGESGTGKELVARAVHENSLRASKPFVVVNCGAIPSELLEAELFGHVKGAFTGATQSRQGRFELAHGGTLFLDEVGDLPLHLQVKLLRVLQTRQFEAVGSSRTVEVDVRIIAATNRDLEDAVAKKEFRDDLYYRLNVIPLKVPALRERKSDIPILVQHFIQQFNEITGYSVEFPSGQILEALMAYDWPGNVRELENLMERLVILKVQGTVDLGDLPHRIFQKYADGRPQGAGALSEWEFPRMVLPHSGVDLKAIVAAFENHLVDQALVRTNGNKNRASELLSMNRTTLVEKLRKRGMIVPLSSKERLPDVASSESELNSPDLQTFSEPSDIGPASGTDAES